MKHPSFIPLIFAVTLSTFGLAKAESHIPIYSNEGESQIRANQTSPSSQFVLTETNGLDIQFKANEQVFSKSDLRDPGFVGLRETIRQAISFAPTESLQVEIVTYFTDRLHIVQSAHRWARFVFRDDDHAELLAKPPLHFEDDIATVYETESEKFFFVTGEDRLQDIRYAVRVSYSEEKVFIFVPLTIRPSENLLKREILFPSINPKSLGKALTLALSEFDPYSR